MSPHADVLDSAVALMSQQMEMSVRACAEQVIRGRFVAVWRHDGIVGFAEEETQVRAEGSIDDDPYENGQWAVFQMVNIEGAKTEWRLCDTNCSNEIASDLMREAQRMIC